MRQFLLMQEGFIRKQKAEEIKILESWKQARLVAYNVIKPYLKNQNMTMYDYFSLPDDPDKSAQVADAEALAVIEYYTQQGWLKKNEA